MIDLSEKTDKNIFNLDQINKKQSFYKYTLQTRVPTFFKCIFLSVFLYIHHIKKHLIRKGQKVDIKHLPQINKSERVENLVNAFSRKITDKNENINKWDLLKLTYFGPFKCLIFNSIILLTLDNVGKTLISFFLEKLIDAVLINDYDNSLKYALIIFLVDILTTVSRHFGIFNISGYCFQFGSMSRMGLTTIIYQKLLLLNQFTLQQANLGKIQNVVSADLPILEIQFAVAGNIVISPLQGILTIILLIFRFGPAGLLCLLFLALYYPYSILMSRMSQHQIILQKKKADQRINRTHEVIEGIRLIKLYVWEKYFQRIIDLFRNQESKFLRGYLFYFFMDKVVYHYSQIWSPIFFFMIYYYGLKQELTLAQMLATFQLISVFKFTCVFLISRVIQAWHYIFLCFSRVSDILNLQNYSMIKLDDDENDQQLMFQQNTANPPLIEFQNFTSYWEKTVSKNTQPVLQNLNLSIQEGDLIGVIGKVSSGKTTFLNAILQEIPNYKGRYFFKGKQVTEPITDTTFAYVEQEPVIFPESLRSNVLFGREYNPKNYANAIKYSQLLSDIKMFKDQDMTEIGQRGINLSGGQKARLSLARALYSLADVYLLDDPISAVDAKVAAKIFQQTILRFMYTVQPKITNKKPTVIIVTHQIQYALQCEKIILLDKGKLQGYGTEQEIKGIWQPDFENQEQQIKKQQNPEEQIHQTQNQKEKLVEKRKDQDSSQKKDAQKLYQDELKNEQIVSLKSLSRLYRNQTPRVLPFFTLILYIACEVIFTVLFRYVSRYNEYVQQNCKQINNFNKLTFLAVDELYLILCIFIAALFIFSFFKYLGNYTGLVNANNNFHNQMLKKLVKAPVSYFDTNPSGRILSRFSSDLGQVDTLISECISDVYELEFYFLIQLITVVFLQYYFIIGIIISIFFNTMLLFYFKDVIVYLKENVQLLYGPLFDYFSKTVSGVQQIRICRQKNAFQTRFQDICAYATLSSLTFHYASRSFAQYIDVANNLVSGLGLFLVIHLNTDDPASLVQSLLIVLTVNQYQQWALRQIMNLYAYLGIYLRIFEVIDMNEEKPYVQPSDRQVQIQNWPNQGQITYDNVVMRYRKETEIILKGINFQINGGEKIACVGRTGSGKTSILQTLFRIVELESGFVKLSTNLNISYKKRTISIDDQNITTLGLETLRQKLSIIPQQPFIFNGTVRENLDPLNVLLSYFLYISLSKIFTDDEIWSVLKDVQLEEKVNELNSNLRTDISNSNQIFSVGQKQLVCLARAILNKRKILILDEATANVDLKTDEFIQQKIKERFSDCTIFTIAHRLLIKTLFDLIIQRLNTVADYDKVLVMDDGQVREFDEVYKLLAKNQDSTYIDQNTAFSQMVLATGTQNSEWIFNTSKQKYINEK